MANDSYQIYHEQCTRLAETMVVKFDVSAVATNRYLTLVGIPVEADRRTWRYYMNMAGLYHSSNRLMRVQSLDTREMIDFTVENLEIHRATARGYAYGTAKYNELLAANPKQESLILGILNPIDIDEAIAAPEYTVLYLDPTLVEAAEDNLKELIQDSIIALMDRWHVAMYSEIDDLYDAGRIIVLGAFMTDMVFSARLRNDRTHRAHSFFIQQYLARYGRLDKFMDAMMPNQQQFFYRNLVHFHKYPGHQDSFEWLTDKVMADRNLPLADHRLLQNESAMPDNLSPEIELGRSELTRQYAGVPDTRVSVDRVVAKQARLATMNRFVEDINKKSTVELMTLAKSNIATTKVLESSVWDLKDSLPLKLEDMLISNWFYLAKVGKYRALTPFVDQRTGEASQLEPLDAFIVFLYCFNRANGLELPIVPTITANHIVKDTVPTTQQMYDMVSGKHFTLKTARIIHDMIPEVGTIVSTESFYDTIYKVWDGALNQFNYASTRGHYKARAEIEIMALYMFNDVGVDLADTPGQTMEQWLHSRGLDVLLEYTGLEYDAVWTDLLSKATGADLNTTLSLAYIHRAMIGVMERLSSYSVQFVREINEGPLKALANKWMWPGDSDGSATGIGYVALPKVGLVGSKGDGRGRIAAEINLNQIVERKSNPHGSSYIPIGIQLMSSGEVSHKSEMAISSMWIQSPPPPIPRDITGETYDSDVTLLPVYPDGRPIGEFLLNRVLLGLNLPGTSGEDISTAIAVKTLSGINPPATVPELHLAYAIPMLDLGGFIADIGPDDEWIGKALPVKVLSGLNLPTSD